MNNLSNLSRDVQLYMLQVGNVDPRDLKALACVNKNFKKIAEDDQIWKKMVENRFSSENSADKEYASKHGWKKLYYNFHEKNLKDRPATHLAISFPDGDIKHLHIRCFNIQDRSKIEKGQKVSFKPKAKVFYDIHYPEDKFKIVEIFCIGLIREDYMKGFD